MSPACRPDRGERATHRRREHAAHHVRRVGGRGRDRRRELDRVEPQRGCQLRGEVVGARRLGGDHLDADDPLPARLRQQPGHRRPARAELFGDLGLRRVLEVVELGGGVQHRRVEAAAVCRTQPVTRCRLRSRCRHRCSIAATTRERASTRQKTSEHSCWTSVQRRASVSVDDAARCPRPGRTWSPEQRGSPMAVQTTDDTEHRRHPRHPHHDAGRGLPRPRGLPPRRGPRPHPRTRTRSSSRSRPSGSAPAT